MRPAKFLIFSTTLILVLSTLLFADSENEDYAVPALIDAPVLNLPSNNPQMLRPATLKEMVNPFPTTEQLKWFDFNRDLQLDDFDLKQFESIIAGLKGEKLSGLQLTIRFRGAQKNQKDSFPVLYDLDRDGMFTSYDVDYFTGVINRLDEGTSLGNELVEKFRLQVTSKK